MHSLVHFFAQRVVGKDAFSGKVAPVNSPVVNIIAEQSFHLFSQFRVFGNEAFGLRVSVKNGVPLSGYLPCYSRFAASYASCQSDNHVFQNWK